MIKQKLEQIKMNDKIRGVCPNCGEERDFAYTRHHKVRIAMRDTYHSLYQCQKCKIEIEYF